jgi:hypothetical protein
MLRGLGYAAPQLHTHAVFFNVTERDNGETRALQPRELYKSQAYLTAVYRSELAMRLRALGYEIERGDSEQPEIPGYTPEYLEASSPRSQQIQAYLAKVHQSGAEAAHIAATQTREAKIDGSHEEVQRQHQARAEAFGHQAAHAVQAARERALANEPHAPGITAHEAVTYAKDRNLEREPLVDDRALLGDALRRSMSEVSVGAIWDEFEHRATAAEFMRVAKPPGAPGRAFTTQEMIDLERDTIARMRAGQQTLPAVASGRTQHDIERAYPQLSEHQRDAVRHILASQDQVLALEGVAGAGKTTALAAVRDGAEREGYRVEGFAPTSRAAEKLGDAGITTSTLQRHLVRQEPRRDEQPRLYVLDESSLASTRQMHQFLHRLQPQDRVLLVGDVRQHQAVEAGRPYQQLQEAGIETVRLDDIVRQQDPALKQVVEHLSRGEVRDAIDELDQQARVHEVPDRDERPIAIAHEYARYPEGTLVVSPDNQSRREINQIIHDRMQIGGQVDPNEHRVRVLVTRQDITGADRQWAQQYQPGDMVRYTRGSQVLAIRAGEYARVDQVHATDNRLTVTRADGEPVTYDPRRLQGVTVYREADRAFAVGDRVQFTAPYRDRHVANRELATIEAIEPTGEMRLRFDAGRTIAFTVAEHWRALTVAVVGWAMVEVLASRFSHRAILHVAKRPIYK